MIPWEMPGLVVQAMIGLTQSGGNIDHVGAGPFQSYGDHARIDMGNPTGRIVIVAIDPADHRVVLTAGPFDLLDNFGAELQSPFHSAIFVGTLVDERGQE